MHNRNKISIDIGGIYMTLDKAKKGSRVMIKNINDKDIKSQAIRIGLYEGAVFMCSEKLPGGPVILQSKLQEIAIGRGLAANIDIEGVR
ncbi:MAG: ferrous iron transport protein [Clostridia bacterium]|jgi:ferrous iron transport protein A|nr:ferrous iron transport protein [Clostridia bacterium]